MITLKNKNTHKLSNTSRNTSGGRTLRNGKVLAEITRKTTLATAKQHTVQTPEAEVVQPGELANKKLEKKSHSDDR